MDEAPYTLATFNSIIFVHTCIVVRSLPILGPSRRQQRVDANGLVDERLGASLPRREGAIMKSFLIRYRLQNASPEEWHKDVAAFIAGLDNDPALKGKIAYRCMKIRDSADYLHLATAADDQAIKALQQSPLFSGYTEKTRAAAGGAVDVLPLDIIAETQTKV
jgi:hypothetical protein